MKKSDYNLVAALETVRTVKLLLLDIMPGNNPQIDKKQYSQVMKTIRKWESSLYEDLELDDE